MPHVNPFDTLGLEPRFDLDLAHLADRQRKLSHALHPDRFVGRPAGERRDALSRAIEVNEAHRKLKHPITRGEALLDLLGLHLPEGEVPAATPELLMETMERREALREAGRDKDVSKITELAKVVREEEKSLLIALAQDFADAAQTPPLGPSPLVLSLHKKLGHLRYLRRFLDEAGALLDEIS